jgi:hypothetical protein
MRRISGSLALQEDAGVAKQSRMKGHANVTIPALPRASCCFSCRDIDPD